MPLIRPVLDVIFTAATAGDIFRPVKSNVLPKKSGCYNTGIVSDYKPKICK